jgi:hypothetical protein
MAGGRSLEKRLSVLPGFNSLLNPQALNKTAKNADVISEPIAEAPLSSIWVFRSTIGNETYF